MPSIDIFKSIFVTQTIEQDTLELIQYWLPTYLREVESQLGLPINSIAVPKPENYTSRNTYEDLPGEELPKVIVISPGLIQAPLKSGTGQYRATWRLGVGVATARPTEEEAKLHCDIYGAAVRTIMLQKGGGALGGQVHWVDEQYAGIPLGNAIRRYRAASLWFGVDLENVATQRGGPDAPNAEPYEYHTADEVIVDLVKEPING